MFQLKTKQKSCAGEAMARESGLHGFAMRFAEPSRAAVVGLLATLITLLVARSLVNWGFTTDDAYITLRFARNFVEGHGLVFNPGGARIEGYSNPLVLFASVLTIKAGWDPILMIKVLSAASLAALLLATYAMGRNFGAGVWPALAGLVLVGTFPGVVYWVYSGLETVLYMSLVAGGAALLLRRDGVTRGQALVAGTLLGLAAWTRVEGGLYAIFAMLGCAGYWIRHRRAAPHFWCVVPIAIAGVSLLAFRLGYYGRILPNTYYCKASGEPWLLVGEFMAASWPLWVLALSRRGARWDWTTFLVLGACVTHVLLYWRASTLVGQEYRHFLVLVPLLCALAAASVQYFPRMARVVTTEIAFLYAIVLTVALFGNQWHLRDYNVRTEARVKVADYLTRNSDVRDQVMAGDVGVIGYHLRRAIVDPLCLVDEYYAPCFRNDENAFALHALEERRPRWIVIQSSASDHLTEIPVSGSSAILKSEAFKHYVRRQVVAAGTFGHYHLMERLVDAKPFEPVANSSAPRPCPRQ